MHSAVVSVYVRMVVVVGGEAGLCMRVCANLRAKVSLNTCRSTFVRVSVLKLAAEKEDKNCAERSPKRRRRGGRTGLWADQSTSTPAAVTVTLTAGLK